MAGADAERELDRRQAAAGRITRAGDPYLRRLLVVGAHAVLGKKPYTVAAVALANKMARVIWAMMTKGEAFRTAGA